MKKLLFLFLTTLTLSLSSFAGSGYLGSSSYGGWCDNGSSINNWLDLPPTFASAKLWAKATKGNAYAAIADGSYIGQEVQAYSNNAYYTDYDFKYTSSEYHWGLKVIFNCSSQYSGSASAGLTITSW